MRKCRKLENHFRTNVCKYPFSITQCNTHFSNFWELADPIVAGPVEQDNNKRHNIQPYTDIPYFLKYTELVTEGGDITFQCSYLILILSNWVPLGPPVSEVWGESKGCLIKGCLNSTEIPKVGIPKPGIPKSGIPKTEIP